MQKNKFNRKSRIEVYFILYLAALILLLPEDNEIETKPKELTTKIASYLVPEKTVLNCKLKIENNKLVIADLDSINNISVFGDVYNIKYDFQLETKNNNGITRVINQDDLNSIYAVKQNNNDIIFKWKPNLIKEIPSTILVKVTANVISKENNILKEALLNTQFAINIYLENNSNTDIALDDLLDEGVSLGSGEVNITQSDINLLNQQNGLNQITNNPSSNQSNNQSNNQFNNAHNNFQNSNNESIGNFDISPENNIVRSLSRNRWTNFIYFYNLNPIRDLNNKPEVSISYDNGKDDGTVKISETNEKGILLEGNTPNFNPMKVSFSVKRKSDKKEANLTFIVQPVPISKPQYSKIMYPEMNYVIKPNLPLITNEQIKVIIRDNDKIRYTSIDGSDFNFTPNNSDTNKIFYLERYMGNELIGEKYIFNVANYPMPEIIEITKIDDDLFQVKTKSYGIFSGDNNIVSKLLNDDFTFQELVGRYRFENSQNFKIHYQVFNLKSKVKSNNKRELILKVRDKRGYTSNSKKYNY